jgi:carbon starvation protein
MAKDEIGPVGGFAAMVGVFSIMVILIAVLALVVVNALNHSPWGTVTVGLTIPIAMVMGAWMRWFRPNDVTGATILGLLLLALALVAGRWVGEHPQLGPMFTLRSTTLAWSIIAYGFAASVVPVWLLLAPRMRMNLFCAYVMVMILLLVSVGRVYPVESVNVFRLHVHC